MGDVPVGRGLEFEDHCLGDVRSGRRWMNLSNVDSSSPSLPPEWACIFSPGGGSSEFMEFMVPGGHVHVSESTCLTSHTLVDDPMDPENYWLVEENHLPGQSGQSGSM